MYTLVISEKLFYTSLIFIVIVYAYPAIFFIKKFIEEVKKRNKIQTGNNFLSVILFLFLFYNVLYILVTLRSVYKFYLLIWTLNVIPAVIFWIIIISSTIWYNTKGKKPDLNKVREKWIKINSNNSLLEDTKRKIVHLLFFLIMWGVIIVGILIAMKYNHDLSSSYNKFVWEENQTHQDNLLYIEFLSNPTITTS